MDPTIKAIFIVTIVLGSVFGAHYIRYKTRMFEMKLRHEKEFSSELKVELDTIRERLAVIEAIVTEKGYEIKDQINKL